MQDPITPAPSRTQSPDPFPGLVWAYRRTTAGTVERLAPEDALSALDVPADWIWFHLDLVDQRACRWMTASGHLPPEAVDAFSQPAEDGLTIGARANVVYGVLGDLHQELQRQTLQVGRLHFAVGERLLFTGRRHPLASVEKVRGTLESGASPPTAFDLAEAIHAAFCRRVSRQLAEASTSLDRLEDLFITRGITDEKRQLREIRRLAIGLHRPVASTLSPLREADRSDWFLTEAGRDWIEGLTMRLDNLDRDILTLAERAKLMQEEIAAELAEESNRSLRALAVMSALLLPATVVTGMFGMNVGGLPFTQSPYGFIAAFACGVAATWLFYRLMLKAGASLRF